MSRPIRAIYEHGQLRLLDPVTLVEGEEISIVVLRARSPVRVALGDLLAEPPAGSAEPTDDAALAQMIAAAGADLPPVSEAIIAERGEGRWPLTSSVAARWSSATSLEAAASGYEPLSIQPPGTTSSSCRSRPLKSPPQ